MEIINYECDDCGVSISEKPKQDHIVFRRENEGIIKEGKITFNMLKENMYVTNSDICYDCQLSILQGVIKEIKDIKRNL